jgi:hypothetical protein
MDESRADFGRRVDIDSNRHTESATHGNEGRHDATLHRADSARDQVCCRAVLSLRARDRHGSPGSGLSRSQPDMHLDLLALAERQVFRETVRGRDDGWRHPDF